LHFGVTEVVGSTNQGCFGDEGGVPRDDLKNFTVLAS